MADLNVFSGVGRLTKDAELTYSRSGFAITNFTIAVNSYNHSTKKDEPSFISCVMFGKRGERIAQYLKKGLKISVTGELVQERWTDKNGQARQTYKVKVSGIYFVESQKSGSDAPQKSSQTNEKGPTSDFFNDDVPF
jgi:single-strand DNA-binding protein